MTFLSLFSGIGGLDLGLERAGMRCIGQVEIDPFCRRVLAKHWPDVPKYADIRTLNREQLEGFNIDLIAGGFPCQNVSNAGGREGIEGSQSALWFEFARLVRELRPRFVFVENVAALNIRGLDRVLQDLATLGFDAEWSVLSACAMGAPHTRERLFIVAHPQSVRWCESAVWGEGVRRGVPGSTDQWNERQIDDASRSPLVRVADGIPNRLERITALGNAVVPQVAEWIGRRIMAARTTP